MQIASQHIEKMENIIAAMKNDGVKCPKDFECHTSSLENMCKIKGVVGSFDIIECGSEDAQCCGFSFVAAEEHYCNCPLRKYIAANFHI